MIDGSEKRNCQLAFELLNSHLCEKCSNLYFIYFYIYFTFAYEIACVH